MLLVNICWGWFLCLFVFFRGAFFRIRLVFPLRQSIWYVAFFRKLTQLLSISVADGRGFLNQNRCMLSCNGVFQLGIFLSFLPRESWCLFTSGLFSSPCNSFLMLLNDIYPFDFAVMLLLFISYIAPKLFCYLCIWLFSSHAMSTDLFVEFSLVILQAPFCLYWFCYFLLEGFSRQL